MTGNRPPLYEHEPTTGDGTPSVTIDPDVEGDPVDPFLFGKFTEHLGWNIYHGMDANTTFNPTLGQWRFREESPHPDGGFVGESDEAEIRDRIERYADEQDYPAAEPLVEAFEDGLAFPWLPHGEGVTTSADTNRVGERAQRIGTTEDGSGIEQWLYLPLQRTGRYEYTVTARAPEGADLEIAVHALEGGEPAGTLASDALEVGEEWTTVEGTLAVEDDLPPEDLYALTLTRADPGDVVVDRVLLYPDDHVHRADPDVVEFYREADLPVLRWPGGNFVSGYDWRDGIGPLEERPTNPNPAWDGIEPNLFGTAEFVQFCRDVGAEPTICVNAGDGTPGEAAKWVEYCNGSTDTEMGALRAEHGYEEPFDVEYWEVGNELWGFWQTRYTTPTGNADRYERFHDAIEEVDPGVNLQACGYRHDEDWNPTLAETVPAEKLRAITTHPLAGANDLSRTASAVDVYHSFQGFPDQLREVFEAFLETMREGGVEDPTLAVTELQQFADLEPEGEGDADAGGVTEETMPTPTTLSEALYVASVVNHCIRMGGDVELLTHSAAVNHGGGLQKRKERVFPDPVYYGLRMGVALAGGTPLGVSVACETFSSDLRNGEIEPVEEAPAIDALAVEDGDAVSVLLVVRPARDGPDAVRLDVSALAEVDGDAEVTTLTADAFHAENDVENPDRVSPTTESVPVTDGVADVPVASPGLVRVDIDR